MAFNTLDSVVLKIAHASMVKRYKSKKTQIPTFLDQLVRKAH